MSRISIHDRNLYGKSKLERSIMILQEFEPAEGYYVANSYGKDSITVEKLCELAGVKYDSHHNHTTADPPELVEFGRKNYPNTIVHFPNLSLWELIEKKLIPPTRKVRYCCDVLKERGGEGRVVVTGVRWAESARRKNTRGSIEIFSKSKAKKFLENKKIFLNSDNDEKRRMIESCFQKDKKVVNPILDWEDSEVWEFINEYDLKYCELYDQGFERLGCIGCPLSSNARWELEVKFPKYKKLYLMAFEKMIQERKKRGKKCDWETAEEVYDRWLPNKL